MNAGFGFNFLRELNIHIYLLFIDQWWLLQGKQPQEVWLENCMIFWFIIFFPCSLVLWICSECCCRAAALHSSAFLCTAAILFINFSSNFDLIFCIFTWTIHFEWPKFHLSVHNVQIRPLCIIKVNAAKLMQWQTIMYPLGGPLCASTFCTLY